LQFTPKDSIAKERREAVLAPALAQ
jgi:hypothetical protein